MGRGAERDRPDLRAQAGVEVPEAAERIGRVFLIFGNLSEPLAADGAVVGVRVAAAADPHGVPQEAGALLLIGGAPRLHADAVAHVGAERAEAAAAAHDPSWHRVPTDERGGPRGLTRAAIATRPGRPRAAP